MKLISPLLLSLFASAAFAHDGSRVWIGNDDGVIRTYSSDDDLDPALYFPSQVFTDTLTPFFGVYTTEFPGYEVRRDGGSVQSDTLFGFRMAGPLLMLAPTQNRLRPTTHLFPANAPQMGVTLGDTTLISSTGVQDGFDFFNFGGVGDHAHLSFTLLGQGNSPTATTPEGVYVLPMILTSSRLARSNWYFLVLDKNGTAQQIGQAKPLAQAMAGAAPGDTNFDGVVDFDDLLTLAQNYGAPSGRWWADGDFDFDGNVDFDDLLTLAQQYGQGAGRSFAADWSLARSIVPEPSTLLCGIPIFTSRRRR